MNKPTSPFGNADAEFENVTDQDQDTAASFRAGAQGDNDEQELTPVDKSGTVVAASPNSSIAAKPAGSNGKTFDLAFGIEVDGKTYDQLHLRRAKAKDRRAMARIEDVTEQQATLIANLASIPGGPGTVPLEAIDELDMADYTLLSSYVNQNFFGLKPAS